MIKVSGLTKDYGARRAIHNLNFDAQQGEIAPGKPPPCAS
jgi:ABC-type multidrug transport system ATPase subunit